MLYLLNELVEVFPEFFELATHQFIFTTEPVISVDPLPAMDTLDPDMAAPGPESSTEPLPPDRATLAPVISWSPSAPDLTFAPWMVTPEPSRTMEPPAVTNSILVPCNLIRALPTSIFGLVT